MSETGSQQTAKKIDRNSGSEELLKECGAVESELAALKSRYEQYFVGVERSRPAVAHMVLRRRIEDLKSTFNRTTAVKFRVKNITSKFLAYERLWNRTMLEMENSKHRPDLFKARMRAKNRGQEGSTADVAPANKAEGAKTTRPAPAPGELSDAKLRAIYDAYVAAKKQCQEDVSKLTYDSVASKLRKQVPDLMKAHKAQSVEFKIVIKNGKAVLKAVPRGGSDDSR